MAQVNTHKSKRILLVAANPGVHATLNYPVGFWGSELTHPWLEFTEAGYTVDIASPNGGEILLDGFSDPRHESKYSAHDVITLGFITSPQHSELLKSTKSINKGEVNVNDYDAVVVAGGQGPMFQFRKEPKLHALLAAFYEKEKITAALCHGTAVLLDVKLSNGSALIAGKTMTGFANVEEDYADAYMKVKVMPFRIEDEAKKLGANFITGGLFRPFAVRDGRLITGQQQYSGKEVAKTVIQALGQ